MNEHMEVKATRVKFALQEVCGLTVSQISDQLCASERTVYNWLSGTHLNQRKINKISEFLKINPVWFEIQENVFDYEEFKEEIFRMKNGKLNKGGCKFLVFSGYDSYSLVTGLNMLKNKGEDIEVIVEGYEHNEVIIEKGCLTDTKIDFYIRNFCIMSNPNINKSVGCKNAVIEDIKAHKITVISNNLYNSVINTEFFPYYQHIEITDIQALYNIGQVLLAINTAKIKGDVVSLRFLLNLIIEEEDEQILISLCSSIKCFESKQHFDIVLIYEERLLKKLFFLIKKGMISPALYMMESIISVWRSKGILKTKFIQINQIINTEGLDRDREVGSSIKIMKQYMCKDLPQ